MNYETVKTNFLNFRYFDSFIFGKANGQIIRIAGVVKAINSAITILEEYPEYQYSKFMDESYYQFIIKHAYSTSIGIYEIKIAD